MYNRKNNFTLTRETISFPNVLMIDCDPAGITRSPPPLICALLKINNFWVVLHVLIGGHSTPTLNFLIEINNYGV